MVDLPLIPVGLDPLVIFIIILHNDNTVCAEYYKPKFGFEPPLGK